MVKTQLLNHPVDVCFADPSEHSETVKAEHPEPQTLRGCWITDENKVWITPSDDADRRMQTLLHECCHAIDDHLGLDLSHQQVYALGAGLAQILAPWLRPIDSPVKPK